MTLLKTSTRSTGLRSLAFLTFLAVPSLASANGPVPAPGDETETETETEELDIDANVPTISTEVWGGSETEPCAWPSVVQVNGGGSLCTGTLIHPQVIMFAAHCGVDEKTIRFGDSFNSGNNRDTSFCKLSPQYLTQGTQEEFDWAYCVLEEEVHEVPFTPVGFGCEIDQYFYEGAEVAVVGFGNNTGMEGSGRKRWAFTDAFNVSTYTFNVGGNGNSSICSGDSGGPAFVRYEDGSWHNFGIASTKFGDGTCNDNAATHASAIEAVKWIEQDSGIDVTPCHDLNGNWNPNHYCGNISNSQPALTGGSWYTWCQETTALDWSSTCGPDFYSDNNELNPPQVQIQIPYDGQVFEEDPAAFDITVVAEDDSGLPVEIGLALDGEPLQDTYTESPAIWDGAAFPDGTYVLTATATDFWGNIATSEVSFTVLDASADDSADDEDSDDGEDEVGETDEGAPFNPVEEQGCACSADASPGDPGPGALWAGLGLLGLLGLRRRR